VLPDDLLGLVALDPFGSRIPGGDVALRVQPEDGVVLGPFDQEPKLIGLVPRPLLVLVEFNEPPDLRLQDDRQQRLHQEVHRSERIPLLDLRAVDVAGGQEDDGRMLGADLAPDCPRRLEPADSRHQDIEEDDGELVGLHSLDGFLTGASFHEVLAQAVEQRPQREEVGRVVIHEENAGPRLRRLAPRGDQGFRHIRHMPPSWVRSSLNQRSAAVRSPGIDSRSHFTEGCGCRQAERRRPAAGNIQRQ
jgi:hypothetical protein